jgi:hypothetical protein
MPEAEARLREALAFPDATAGEQYTRPSGRKSSDSEEESFTSQATKRAKKSKGRGRGSTRQNRSEGIPGALWAAIIVGIAVVVIVIVVASIKLSGGPSKTTEPERAPTQKDEHKKDEHIKAKPPVKKTSQ